MELVIYNTDFIIVGVVDVFKSFIWTDRYNKCGDFEFYTNVSTELLNLFKQDYYIQIKESDHTMIVSNIEIETNIEEGNYLKVTGNSLEYILKRRYIYPQTSFTGSLQDSVESMLNSTIISPDDPKRRIPNFIFEASDDPAITALSIDAQYTGDDLYTVICNLCEKNKIGFKIILDDAFNFVFSLYAGANRSYTQSANPFVVFSPEFENIIDSNYLYSSVDYCNVVLVAGEGEDASRKTLLVGDTDSEGLWRRELFTDARDLSSSQDDQQLTSEQYNELLRTRGLEKLEENKIDQTFEGKTETSKLFVYGEDFFLGDIVQLVNDYGLEYSSRIVEIVFSEDLEGYSVFPSFEILNDTEEGE